MKKLTIMVVMAMLCLKFQANAQDKATKPVFTDPLAKCKWGITGYKSGFEPVCKITPSLFNTWKRIIVYNYTLPELYAVAINAGISLPRENLIIDVREPEKLTAKYCYELNSPPELVDQMFVNMQLSLAYHFPDYTAKATTKTIGNKQVNVILITDTEYGILLDVDRNSVTEDKVKSKNRR